MPADRTLRTLTGDTAVPRKNGELVFDSPWQSRVFGIAVGLAERGFFQWDEFRDRLIAEVAGAAPAASGESSATVYYRQWTAALEKLLRHKGVLSDHDLAQRTEQFASGERDDVY